MFVWYKQEYHANPTYLVLFSASNQYIPTATITWLVKFIKTLDKNKETRNKTPESHALFHNTFVALTKISPEIFENAWTNESDLLPSTAGLVCVASNLVLGSA